MRDVAGAAGTTLAGCGHWKYPPRAQFSTDGEWFWDGTRWQPAYSPDRMWRWDGAHWISTRQSMPPQWRYERTEWTLRLQVALVALTIVGWVFGIELVNAFVLPNTQRMVDAMLASSPPDPNFDGQSFRSMMAASFMFGSIVGLAFVAIVVAGIVRLWRWVYWYLVVTLLIAPLGPIQFVTMYLSGPSSAPGWLLALSFPFAAIEAALGIWMIMLYRRCGTWARRRLPA
jgi:hypothetical protein